MLLQTETNAQKDAAAACSGSAATGRVTILVPAYNEAGSIAATIQSLHEQTVRPADILVIDDFSSDETGRIAREAGARVVRPPQNTGSKAAAQNFGLEFVQTEFVGAVDADTTLAPDAIEKILPALNDPSVAAACGFVVPRRIHTLWERARYIEYLFAFAYCKPIQDYYDRPMISSGCFSVYRTETLRHAGGWSTRTLAEDVDLTWTLYQKGLRVRFVPEAVCYPLEPHNLFYMGRQLKRWSHGFVQNVRLHWRGVLEIPFLRDIVAVALWDALVASLIFLLGVPLLALLVSPIFLLAYVIDAPAVIVPTVYAGLTRKELRRVLASLPCFFVLRLVNSIFMMQAAWSELVLRKPFLVYEKGH